MKKYLLFQHHQEVGLEDMLELLCRHMKEILDPYKEQSKNQFRQPHGQKTDSQDMPAHIGVRHYL